MKKYLKIVDKELTCTYCGKSFSCNRKRFYRFKDKSKKNPEKTIMCDSCKHKMYQVIKLICPECKKSFERRKSQFNRSKSGFCFCSSSCSSKYNNKNKTYGTRRSKLEIVLEDFIRSSFPKLEVKCNSKTEIGSELDFYFPSLKLAIEINGIYHYEPIHGSDKLTQIQNNDKAKLRACDEKNIDLIIVSDLVSSTSKIWIDYFKNKISEIIKNRIN